MKKSGSFLILAIMTILLCACQTTGQSAGKDALGPQAGKSVEEETAQIQTGIAAIDLINRSMNRQDHAKVTSALEYKDDNQSSSWENKNTGNKYSVTPTHTYASRGGEYGALMCREYAIEAIIAGKIEKSSGKACRQSDGNWKNED